ncbi:hypothetical protein FRB99_007754 [Tulasnella sp. 403]|nr:hypothetical protein FRB99_007754 [Tulasnella sp. 403]
MWSPTHRNCRTTRLLIPSLYNQKESQDSGAHRCAGFVNLMIALTQKPRFMASEIPPALPSPPPVVLMWDTLTESFSPHIPDPHSSAPTQSHVHSLPLSDLPSKRSRRHSNPESIVSFDEFLKQIERDKPMSSHDHHDYSSSISPTQTSHPSFFEGSSKHSGKNPLKTVLKEVLGGGGNHEKLPKDAVVPSFGRGGVARNPGKGKATTSTSVRQDPYYAHVPFGPSTSPTSAFFPPNSMHPHTRTKSNSPRDEYTPMFGSPEAYPASYVPRTSNQFQTTDRSQQSTSSSSITNSDGMDGLARRPSHPAAGYPYPLAVETRNSARTRSRSVVSPLTASDSSIKTPPTNSSVGVFLHPEQAALEAVLAERARSQSQGSEKEKSPSPDSVKVVISSVDSRNDSTRRDVRDVDVISVTDTELDDILSLSNFPLPPSLGPSPLQTRRDDPLSSLAPTRMTTGVSPQLPGRLGRVPLKGRLPTMPEPSTFQPLLSAPHPPSGRPQLTLQPPDQLSLPPAPVLTPPDPRRPQAAYPDREAGFVAPGYQALPVRRGSVPANASLGTNDVNEAWRHHPLSSVMPTAHPTGPTFPQDISALLAALSLGGQLPPSPVDPQVLNTLDTNTLLQHQTQVLERERQALEARVRGLMVLVNQLEGQKTLPTEIAGHGSGSNQTTPTNTKEKRTPSPSDTDPRSSTSTERAETYLPYAR